MIKCFILSMVIMAILMMTFKRIALLFIRDTNTLSAGDLFAFLKIKKIQKV